MNVSVRKIQKRLSWEERHLQLINVASTFVSNNGVDNLTLAKIAEMAGISKPVAYDHFKTKERLIIELCREFDKKLRVEIQDMFEEGRKLHDITLAIARAYLQCYAQSSAGWQAAFSSMRANPATQEAYQKMIDSHVDLLVNAFRGRTRMEEKELTLACIGLLGAVEAISGAMMQEKVDLAIATEALALMFLKVLGSS